MENKVTCAKSVMVGGNIFKVCAANFEMRDANFKVLHANFEVYDTNLEVHAMNFEVHEANFKEYDTHFEGRAAKHHICDAMKSGICARRVE